MLQQWILKPEPGMLEPQDKSPVKESNLALSRRNFLALSGTGLAATLAFDPIRKLIGRGHILADASTPALRNGYGALQPDPNGILDLPAGFQYRVISRTGETMTDGYRVPGAPDGMAAFQSPDGNVFVVRNHELSPWQRPAVSGSSSYDAKCNGGTTTFVLDRDRQLVRQHSSLVGTYRNCSGGPTPWNTYITCEETVATPDDEPILKRHGYNFEVAAFGDRPAEPTPLKAMGRFNHEAIAVDPKTGIIYQTEDRNDGLFYRFIPNVPGELSQGGKLEALMIKGQPQAKTKQGFKVGQTLDVEWVSIDNPDPAKDTVRSEGFSQGAAQFSRGEGMTYADNSIYFTCTNGGSNQTGQIWCYHPNRDDIRSGQLSLFVEPNDNRTLDYPDNLTLAPFGEFFVCEDGAGEQYLRAIDREGHISNFARNALNNSEFAGVCFSTNPLTLFVNIQTPGITLAVWGGFHTLDA